MSVSKTDDPLRRHYGAIRTCLTRGKRFGRSHYYALAAGHLLIVCKLTGETARQASRRLGLDGWTMQMLRRDCPQAARALRDINRPLRACVRGADCTCQQKGMRPRCANWRRGDPQQFDLGAADTSGSGLDIALALVDEWAKSTIGTTIEAPIKRKRNRR